MLFRGAALFVIAVASGGAGCPGDSGGTEGDTDAFGTDASSFGTDTPDPTTTTSPTTTTPTTTTPTTEPTTTTPTTTTPTTDPDTSATDPTDTDPTDPSDTSGTGCGSGGPFTISMTGRTDLYGHFPFLFLFFPEDPPTTELMNVIVGEDGSITLEVPPRAAGSGSGHSGLAGLTGTIDETCTVAIDSEVEFVSDTGPFGTIQVIIEGTFPGAADGPSIFTMQLQGGNIPSGPITYEVQSE